MRDTATDMPTNTEAIRRNRPDSVKQVVLSALFLGATTSTLAQDLPQNLVPPAADPMFGHSAEYYGISPPGQREASIRSVLSSVQLDRSYLPSSLAAEIAYFTVRLFVGGGGAPTDIADPQSDVELNKRE